MKLAKRSLPGRLFLVVTLVSALSWAFAPSTANALFIELKASNVDLGVTDTVFADVRWEQGADTSTVDFTVDAKEGVFGDGSNFGIQHFGLNSNLDLTTMTFDLPTNWSASFDRNGDGFGVFDVLLSGRGNSRQDPLLFSVTRVGGLLLTPEDFEFPSDLPAGNGQSQFVAHIAGWGTELNGQTSAWFGVPEPATMLLLGSALLGLGLLGRRKFKI